MVHARCAVPVYSNNSALFRSLNLFSWTPFHNMFCDYVTMEEVPAVMRVGKGIEG